MASQTRPEPMNASPHHPKVKVKVRLGSRIFVAGEYVTGRLEMECRGDKGVGIKAIAVDLIGIQELTSRDHSATSTFLHTRRLFQGPGLPPSNAVQAHPLPGDPPLPPHYHTARRGTSTFLFRFPIPASSPAALSFANGIARVRYEVRASVQVAWKGEITLVTDKLEVDIVESFQEDLFGLSEPEGVVVGENGKMWVQGRLVGGILVVGESACVELQVKNHSSKKNTGLTISLTRNLVLPSPTGAKTPPPLQLSDTLLTVPYKGHEYIIPPGAEGVASLVFDVPKDVRGVKGGMRDGAEEEGRQSDPLFEVRCTIVIRVNMGLAAKDIVLEIPVTAVHPAALPELPLPLPEAPYNPHMPSMTPMPPMGGMSPAPYYPYPVQSPYPASPPMGVYVDPNQAQVWFPPLPNPQQQYSSMPQHYQHFSPSHTPVPQQPLYYFPPLPPPNASVSPALVPLPSPSPMPISGDPMALPPPSHVPPASAVPRSPRVPPGVPASLIPGLPSSPQALSPTQSAAASGGSPAGLPSPGSPNAQQNLAVLHSPIPMLSPKQSYNSLRGNAAEGTAAASRSLPRSERVEALERMVAQEAAQVEQQEKTETDLGNKDINKEGREDGSQKRDAVTEDAARSPALVPAPAEALPPKERRLSTSGSPNLEPSSGPGAEQARIDKTLPRTPSPVKIGESLSRLSPQMPHATAPIKAKRETLAAPPQAKGESGLDALERRLLADVGTRKHEQQRHPHVQSVFGSLPSTTTADDSQSSHASLSVFPPTSSPSLSPPGINDAVPTLAPPDNDTSPARSVSQMPTPKPRPIDIPPGKGRNPEDSNLDSAISSLALAGDGGAPIPGWLEREWDSGKGLSGSHPSHGGRGEREKEFDDSHDTDDDRTTHRPTKSRSSVGGGDEHSSKSGAEKSERRKKRKAKEREKGGEMRRAAKGRVAEWLGGVEPTSPPADKAAFAGEQGLALPPAGDFEPSSPSRKDFSRPPSPPAANVPQGKPADADRKAIQEPIVSQDKSTEEPAVSSAKPVEPGSPDIGEPAKPNPRSSGFVPISAFKRDPTAVETYKRLSSIKGGGCKAPEPQIRRVADIWNNAGAGDNTPRATGRSPVPELSSPVKVSKEVHLGFGKKFPMHPASPRLDSDVKYDVRSARGGRGGKVTAVAAIWASGAVDAGAKPKSPVSPSAWDKDKARSPQLPPRTFKPYIPDRKDAALASLGGKEDKAKPSPSGAAGKMPLTTTKPAWLLATSQKSPATSSPASGGSPNGTEPGVSRTPRSKKPTLVSDLDQKSRPMIKSASVPALVSSSLATPVLSTTASLARAADGSAKAKPSSGRSGDVRSPPPRGQLATALPTVSEDVSRSASAGKAVQAKPVHALASKSISPQTTSDSAAAKKAAGADMAFGQARLRDLIKKYQGQSS